MNGWKSLFGGNKSKQSIPKQSIFKQQLMLEGELLHLPTPPDGAAGDLKVAHACIKLAESMTKIPTVLRAAETKRVIEQIKRGSRNRSQIEIIVTM
jgi:hypothetical protein